MVEQTLPTSGMAQAATPPSNDLSNAYTVDLSSSGTMSANMALLLDPHLAEQTPVIGPGIVCTSCTSAHVASRTLATWAGTFLANPMGPAFVMTCRDSSERGAWALACTGYKQHAGGLRPCSCALCSRAAVAQAGMHARTHPLTTAARIPQPGWQQPSPGQAGSINSISPLPGIAKIPLQSRRGLSGGPHQEMEQPSTNMTQAYSQATLGCSGEGTGRPLSHRADRGSPSVTLTWQAMMRPPEGLHLAMASPVQMCVMQWAAEERGVLVAVCGVAWLHVHAGVDADC